MRLACLKGHNSPLGMQGLLWLDKYTVVITVINGGHRGICAGYLWPRDICLAQSWHDWFRLRRCGRRDSHSNVLCLSQLHSRRMDGMDVEEIQDGVLKLKWSKIYIFCECLWRCSGHGNDRRIGQMATRFSFGEFRPRRDASKLF